MDLILGPTTRLQSGSETKWVKALILPLQPQERAWVVLPIAGEYLRVRRRAAVAPSHVCSLAVFNSNFSFLLFLSTAQVSGMNVFASRSFENHRGIEVMDKEGHVVGHSRKAGRKAIKDTAKSRAVLFGTSALAPELFIHIFKRTRFYPETLLSLVILRMSSTFFMMGLMVPVSFSMFPQIGQIQCSQLEEKIQSSTEEKELFYYRGV